MGLPGKQFLTNLIERRALLLQLVRRDFQQRYVGSMAGWVWGLVHPLIMLAVWTFVFSVCMKVEMPRGSITSDYTLFLLAGYLPWLLFQETVARSASSLVDHANLITKTVFPSEIVPVSIFLSSLINHAFALLAVVIGIVWWQRTISPGLLLLPIYIVLLGLLAIGIGWIVASLQVYIRDTAQVVLVLLTVGMWMTPIFIFETYFPPRFHFLLDYNPMAAIVEGYRALLLSAKGPDLRDLGMVAFYSVASFVAGGLFFRQLKRGFADVL
ncbi:MAG: ABC transporter permease [Bryobacteraceae bacterium]